MHKFTHLESLKAAHQTARRADPPIGRVSYRGTVKLHGCNAGVVCTEAGLSPQSRNRALTRADDHMGFAAFVEAHTPEIRLVEAEVRRQGAITSDRPIVLFGEWIGPGVQRNVAVSGLPERQWVLFAFAEVDGPDLRYFDADPPQIGPIRSVLAAGVWTIEIDFLDWRRTVALEQVERWTQEVDARCPYGALHGLEGPGEGIVWVPTGEHAGRMDLAFKTKGQAHKETGPRPDRSAARDDAKAYAQSVADSLCPDPRLAKGLDFLAESGLPLDRSSLGPFLKWVCQDVLRECAHEIEESGIDWKRLSGPVASCARTYFERALRDASAA